MLGLIRLWAKLRGTTATCVQSGHWTVKVGPSDNLYHQKGGTRQTRNYFSGVYYECRRDGCKWTAFVGERRANRREVITDNVTGMGA